MRLIRIQRTFATSKPLLLATVVLVAGLSAGPAWAQDDEVELGWADTAELTAVFSEGNAESSTLGFRNRLTHTWEGAVIAVEGGALRAESTRFTRSAVGTADSFAATKTGVSELTAESYFARGRYDRQMNERTFWYVGAGWERNTFTGIANRDSWSGGVGNTWTDDPVSTFKTAYGVTYTVQDDVDRNGGDLDTFAGLRFAYDYRRQVTVTTEFTSVLAADENLEETGDFRIDMTHAIAVSMTDQLALKVSWQMLYDNAPALARVPLVSPGGDSTGVGVLVPLDTVDHLLTFALVATF